MIDVPPPRTPNRLLALIPSLLFALVASPALAEDVEQEPGSVVVSVRTIQASDPIEPEPREGEEAQAPKVPADLSDIEAKLSQLPFRSFLLLSSKSETHSLKKREMMKLPNGQTLVFRPMYMDQKRVGLWLNWRDADNSEILNTRVHFDTDDSVVTGMDCAENKGLILAIKAKPIPTPGGDQTGH
jgi:hypothetical protein